MKKRSWVGAVTFALLAVCSCVNPKVTNLTPVSLYGDPVVSTHIDSSVVFSAYKTFSVFPYSETSDKKPSNPTLERQMIFYVRNLVEAKGYKFIEIDQNPDFLVTVYTDTEYHQSYVPPSLVTLPYYSLGKTETNYERSTGSSNYSSSGKYSSDDWGTWRGAETSSTDIPGTWTKKTYSRSGYAVGRYYPAAVVSIYDSKTLESVWMGNGAGSSDNPDVRVSAQMVLSHILRDLPECQYKPVHSTSRGVIGAHYSVMTTDGNSYYPFVVGLDRGKPAARKGIRLDDMIIEIDGMSTLNKSFAEIERVFGGKPGEKVVVKVKRVNKIITFRLVCAPGETG